MNKGLEELNIIKENHLQLTKEKYRKLDTKALNTILELRIKHYEIIEKELKALEIIFDCWDIELYRNKQGQCFIKIGNHFSAIAKEKYDILKEVLL